MTVIFRKARRTDVPAIVRMLADDPLGAARERCTDPLPDGYWKAFEAVKGFKSPGGTLIPTRNTFSAAGCSAGCSAGAAVGSAAGAAVASDAAGAAVAAGAAGAAGASGVGAAEPPQALSNSAPTMIRANSFPGSANKR